MGTRSPSAVSGSALRAATHWSGWRQVLQQRRAAIIVFALSGDCGIVLPLILATAVATTVSRRLRRESIYGAELQRKRSRWKLTIEGRKASDPPADSSGEPKGKHEVGQSS